MNKRIEKEIGEKLVEKRGWSWALTSSRLSHGKKPTKLLETSRGTNNALSFA